MRVEDPILQEKINKLIAEHEAKQFRPEELDQAPQYVYFLSDPQEGMNGLIHNGFERQMGAFVRPVADGEAWIVRVLDVEVLAHPSWRAWRKNFDKENSEENSKQDREEA